MSAPAEFLSNVWHLLATWQDRTEAGLFRCQAIHTRLPLRQCNRSCASDSPYCSSHQSAVSRCG